MTPKPAVTVIVGPTASGKTSFAIEKALKRNGAVISADSRQVYSKLDVGTAKPKSSWNTPAHGDDVSEVIDGVPHYLLNVRGPTGSLTLPQWRQAATAAIDATLAKGQHPIIAGGTMLYVDSILFNYNIPEVPPNEKLREELEQLPTPELAAKLQMYDTAALDFVELHNRRRIIRALEVVHATGMPFSVLRRKQEPLYEFDIIGLFPGWKALDAAIDARITTMLATGLIEETKKLREDYGVDLPLLKTMNYAEAGKLIDGILTEEEAIKAMSHANKRYARRQMRWWKGRDDVWWKDAQD